MELEVRGQRTHGQRATDSVDVYKFESGDEAAAKAKFDWLMHLDFTPSWRQQDNTTWISLPATQVDDAKEVMIAYEME